MKKLLLVVSIVGLALSATARPEQFYVFDVKMAMQVLDKADVRAPRDLAPVVPAVIGSQKVDAFLLVDYLGNGDARESIIVFYTKGRILDVQEIGFVSDNYSGEFKKNSLAMGFIFDDGFGGEVVALGKYSNKDGLLKSLSAKGVGVAEMISTDIAGTLDIQLRFNRKVSQKLEELGPEALVSYFVKKMKISEDEANEAVNHIFGRD